jgi:hypothetical protein
MTTYAIIRLADDRIVRDESGWHGVSPAHTRFIEETLELRDVEDYEPDPVRAELRFLQSVFGEALSVEYIYSLPTEVPDVDLY